MIIDIGEDDSEDETEDTTEDSDDDLIDEHERRLSMTHLDNLIIREMHRLVLPHKPRHVQM